MKVKDLWDVLGAIIFIALIAIILTKKNTSSDIAASGKAFTGALSTAAKG